MSPAANSLSAPPNGWSVEKIRRETPGCRNVVHLNNAGCALPCERTLRATEAFYRAEASYGGYESVEKFAPQEQAAYSQMAKLLNCDAEEIAILPSATLAWQQVLFGMQFRPGDVILTTPNEYGSNYLNFLQLQSRHGIRIEVVREDSKGDLDFDHLEELMSTLKPKLMALVHIPTSSGDVYDAVRVGKLAKAFNVPYLLDACQSVGQLPVDVASIGCDFLSGTSRKFLRGPRGIGFLYAAKRTFDTYQPAMLDVRGAVCKARDAYDLQPDARRYEQYELSFAAKVGFGVAVEYCLELGMDWISEQIYKLTCYLYCELGQIQRVHVHDAGVSHSGIVSFTVEGYTANAISYYLRKRTINVSVSGQTSTPIKMREKGLEAVVRASVHYYNTINDLEACLAALREFVAGGRS